jgi:hypothetical protein
MKTIIKKILKDETIKRLSQDDPLINIIKKVVGNEYKDWFSDRWDDERFDYEITFHIPKINMWKVTDEDREYKPLLHSIYSPKPDSIWEGTIYVKIDKFKIVDSEGRVEFFENIDDIHHFALEHFEDYIMDKVIKWVPGANLDVTIDF